MPEDPIEQRIAPNIQWLIGQLREARVALRKAERDYAAEKTMRKEAEQALEDAIEGKQIAEALEKLHKVEQERDRMHAAMNEASDTSIVLRKERDEARRDSVRLDWLEGNLFDLEICERTPGVPLVELRGVSTDEMVVEKTIRLAIDAAMAESQAEKPE